MEPRHLLSIAGLSPEDIRRLIQKGLAFKAKRERASLQGKSIALLFQKPSLRTRVSFDIAMSQLGGHALHLSPQEVGLGQREAIKDVSSVLSRYVSGIVARTASQADVESLARASTVPVINGLSDEEHPTQALADLMSIYEKKGQLEGLTLAFIGEGNNVSHSLLLAACQMGVSFHMASPPGYGLRESCVDQARIYAAQSRAKIFQSTDPREAVRNADVIYTDVWWSMGREKEKEIRQQCFASYQVNKGLVELAKSGALVMHNLPAHRGEEITDEVIDGPHSIVFDQSENRLHMNKAILVDLLG